MRTFKASKDIQFIIERFVEVINLPFDSRNPVIHTGLTGITDVDVRLGEDPMGRVVITAVGDCLLRKTYTIILEARKLVAVREQNHDLNDVTLVVNVEQLLDSNPMVYSLIADLVGTIANGYKKPQYATLASGCGIMTNNYIRDSGGRPPSDGGFVSRAVEPNAANRQGSYTVPPTPEDEPANNVTFYHLNVASRNDVKGVLLPDNVSDPVFLLSKRLRYGLESQEPGDFSNKFPIILLDKLAYENVYNTAGSKGVQTLMGQCPKRLSSDIATISGFNPVEFDASCSRTEIGVARVGDATYRMLTIYHVKNDESTRISFGMSNIAGDLTVFVELDDGQSTNDLRFPVAASLDLWDAKSATEWVNDLTNLVRGVLDNIPMANPTIRSGKINVGNFPQHNHTHCNVRSGSPTTQAK